MTPAIKTRIVLSDKTDVAIRLRALRLTEEALALAVRMGQDARAGSTLNDPASATGIHGWGRTVRGLRENTKQLGYERYAEDRINGVINEAGTMVIMVTTGDSATGNPNATPKSAYQKGVKVRTAVKKNAYQLSLFSLLPPDVVPIRPQVAPEPTCLYWLLVVCEGEEEVRFELSLPDEVGEDNRIESWAERIILDPISIDPTPNAKITPDMEPDIDIPLTRKG